MKPKILILFVAISALYFINACSDDPAGPSPRVFLPGASGSYWLYENYPLDSNSRRITDSVTYDSTVIAGEENKLGKLAKIYRTFSKETLDGNYLPSGEMYFVDENSKVLTHSSFMTSLFGGFEIPLNIEEQWFTLIDNNANAWTVAEIPLSKDTVNLDEMFGLELGDIEVSGKITANGSKGETSDYSFKFDKISITEFTIEFNVEVTIKLLAVPILPPMTENFTREMLLYFSDGIGLVKTQLNPSSMKIELIENTFNFSGEETELYKYELE